MPHIRLSHSAQDIKKFKLGLYYALSFLDSHQQLRASGALPNLPGSLQRAQGYGAEGGQLEQWILSLVYGYVGAALGELTQQHSMVQGLQHGPVRERRSASMRKLECELAEMAVFSCLLLDKMQVCARVMC